MPTRSTEETALVGGLSVLGATHLLDVVRALLPGDAADASALREPEPLPRAAPVSLPDLRDVKGQAAAKRALEIAAAGELSLLMVGPPGTGKSMLAQRLGGLLPDLSHEAALESAAIQSVAGLFHASRWGQRVLRAPHHTASAAALVGGGSPPRPGEASLAHLRALSRRAAGVSACRARGAARADGNRPSSSRGRRGRPISRPASS